MAKTPVTLKVADYADREVMHVHYSFNQAVDKEGQMSGIPRGGYIEVTVKAMNDGNADLLAWMLAPNLAKDGSIEFNETKSGNLMKKIEFKEGYCIDFDEDWEDNVGHSEKIKIVCRELSIGSVQFTNDWK